MTRHEYFLIDAYCTELESTVEDISDKGIKLEQTIFYPRGGGQPEDEGKVVINDKDYKVSKINRTRDGIYLQLDTTPSDITIGDRVNQEVDWDYRFQLMQHHTALHILSAVVWEKYEAKVTGGTIYKDKARLDFDLDQFSQELAQELVDQTNAIIDKDLTITISFVDRKTAENDPELIRTKVNLLPDFITEIRLVKIGDVDLQADGGLHVKHTSEIGEVELLEADNKGKGRKRVVIGVKKS